MRSNYLIVGVLAHVPLRPHHLIHLFVFIFPLFYITLDLQHLRIPILRLILFVQLFDLNLPKFIQCLLFSVELLYLLSDYLDFILQCYYVLPHRLLMRIYVMISATGVPHPSDGLLISTFETHYLLFQGFLLDLLLFDLGVHLYIAFK